MFAALKKHPRIEIPELLALARGKPCMFRIPTVCNSNPETTVWCHSNERIHGRALGKKSHDMFGAFGCSSCHDWYDIQSRRLVDPIERKASFNEAMIRTWIYLFENNHIKVTA